MKHMVKKFFLTATTVATMFVFFAVFGTSTLVESARGEAIVYDDFFETWSIGISGRPADENGLEYGRDEGAPAQIPTPFPFNDRVKFLSQEQMRGGRVNPDDISYFARNRYLMQPLVANGASMTYQAQGVRSVAMNVSFQIFDPNVEEIALERVKLLGSADNVTFTEIPLQAEFKDKVGVNHWFELTNRLELDETFEYYKFTFHLRNNNVWEILVVSVELSAASVPGEVAFIDTFNGQWPIDELGFNEDGMPNYGVGGRLPFIDAEDTSLGRVPFADNFTPQSQLVRYQGLTNGRVAPNPAAFQFNDWTLILAAQEAEVVYHYERTFQNFSIQIFRQIWPNSLDLRDAVTISVSSDDVTYQEVAFNDQVLRTDGTNYYIQLTNVAPLEAGIQFIKIELNHFNNNFWELGLNSVRLMTDRALGIPTFRDTFRNQWTIDALGTNEDGTPNYGVGGRLPFVDPENTALGRVPFRDNFNSVPQLISWTDMVNGRVAPNPASFLFEEWYLHIGASTTAEMIYRFEPGFKNFSLDIERQVYPNSFPMDQAVRVFVSNNGTTWEEVAINYYTLKSRGVDATFNVFNRLQFEDSYEYLKINFAHHNNNLWELGISEVRFYDSSPDALGEVDRIAPELAINWSLPGQLPLNAQVQLPTATATDNVDENPQVSVRVFSPVDSAINLSNNSFFLTSTGTYRVVYRAEDATGNFTTREFTITSFLPDDDDDDDDNVIITPEPSEGMNPLIWVGLAAGVIAIGGVGFILIKRK